MITQFSVGRFEAPGEPMIKKVLEEKVRMRRFVNDMDEV